MIITIYIVREYEGFPIDGFFILENAEAFSETYRKQTGRPCEIDRVKVYDYQEFLTSKLSSKREDENRID